MPGQKHLRSLLVAAFALETLCVTYGLKAPRAAPFLAVPYFLAGTALAVLLLYFPRLELTILRRQPGKGLTGWFTRTHQYKLIVLALLALCMHTLCRYWFDEIPLDINYADMLPIIKVMDQRFLAGHWTHIYDTIPSIWNGVQPIYLPAMWQPFTLAVLFDIDMRWITVAGLLFSFGIFLFIYRPERRNYTSFLTGVLAFVLFWWIFADDMPGVITVSEEGVVIAYYVLLVLALLSGNVLLTGIAVSLCMLSRYALVGWIPAYLLYLFLHRKGRQAVLFTLVGLVCFLLLFLMPVGWDRFMSLAKLPGNYIRFAAIVWQDSPDVFSSSLGFAGFFGPSRIALLHGFLVALSFIVPSLFVLISYFRGRTREFANVPLAALKMSLVVFYSFIDVPYLYLFYTSSFVSLILVAFVVSRQPNDPAPGALRSAR
ncbi:MAG: hypothetical protein Q8937_10730 [Bacteroidota bacterium]|nr:hypothetical protein [Bacteroidota bacterium]